jgi:ElaB/YqjD/DUF883 family membrane-anchored ribosome-binding protein
MAKNTAELSEQLESITKHLGTLGDDVKKTLDSLLSTGLEQSHESKKRLVKLGKKTIKRTEGTIHGHPFLSVLISLAAGLTLGMLLEHKLRS